MILESFCGVCEVQDVDRMSITLDLVKWNGLSCTSREGRPRVGSIPREDLIKSTFKQFVANLYNDVQFFWFQTIWKIKKQVQCLSIQGETNLHFHQIYHKEHTYSTIVYESTGVFEFHFWKSEVSIACWLHPLRGLVPSHSPLFLCGKDSSLGLGWFRGARFCERTCERGGVVPGRFLWFFLRYHIYLTWIYTQKLHA